MLVEENFVDAVVHVMFLTDKQRC